MKGLERVKRPCESEVSYKPIIAILIVGLAAIIAITIYAIIDINQNAALFNNGICAKCGGEYAFTAAIGHKSPTTYLYTCEECGKMIELYNIPEE